jgi:hypothetical protein
MEYRTGGMRWLDRGFVANFVERMGQFTGIPTKVSTKVSPDARCWDGTEAAR